MGTGCSIPHLMAGAFYDSNVFSSNSNIQSDVVAQTGAGLRARSLWERHGIDIQVSIQSLFYRNYSGLNQN